MNQQHLNSEPVIVIRNVFKSFSELDVLKGANLDVFKGENVAILGKSGSGKSVLLKMIVGLLNPDKGEILVLNNNVAQLPIKELNVLRLRVGFSFQSSALYDSMNVFQNLAFPLLMNHKHISQQEITMAIHETLESVGLRDKINEMPAELSGGQRKRIGIARTLILKPEIMLYDEPTSGLDPITSTEINALINQVQEEYKTSAIIITHDLTCAKNTCNRMGILIDGVFSKTGTFQELFESKNEDLQAFYKYNFIQ